MKCKQCEKEFEAKRSTAYFCSGACRIAYHRDGVSVTSASKSLSVTRPPCKRLDVYCHACTDEPTCEYRAKQNTALPGDEVGDGDGDRMIGMGYRPWYQMPIELRALPFSEREQALTDWELIHGTYDWRAEQETQA